MSMAIVRITSYNVCYTKLLRIDGGRSPAETRARDQQLRALAEDNLRPVTQWYQDLAVDEIEPASSVLYLEPTLGKVS